MSVFRQKGPATRDFANWPPTVISDVHPHMRVSPHRPAREHVDNGRRPCRRRRALFVADVRARIGQHLEKAENPAISGVVLLAAGFNATGGRSAPVWLYIDSQGGAVTSTFAIRDTIDEIKLPVYTHCLEKAEGTALVLLAHGARGHRSASRRARLLLLPLESRDGGSSANEIARLEAIMTGMLAADTGQKAEMVARHVTAARSFDAPQARSYSLIDAIDE